MRVQEWSCNCNTLNLHRTPKIKIVNYIVIFITKDLSNALLEKFSTLSCTVMSGQRSQSYTTYNNEYRDPIPLLY